MRLRLKNFRCYSDKEFFIGGNGLVLVSGPSGAGKSTIMMAILFALYGKGTKLTMFGKTSCEVEMELENLKINRRKTPNRLLVWMDGSQYEDDAGQSVIDSYFGLSFETTSYLQQNALNSFILMSPSDKLEFLEKFALKGTDISQLKLKCGSIISQRNKELIAATSQLEIMSEHFNSLTQPVPVPFPIKTRDKEKAIRNQETRLNNCKILIKRLEKKTEELQSQLVEAKVSNARREGITNRIETLKRNISEISQKMTQYQYKGDDVLASNKKKLQTILSQKEYTNLLEKYNQDLARFEAMKETELKEAMAELEHIRSILWVEYSKEQIPQMLKDLKQLEKDSFELETKTTALRQLGDINLEETEKSVRLLRENVEQKTGELSTLELQKNIYTCPSCSVSLRFESNSLHVSDVKGNKNMGEEIYEKAQTELRQLQAKLKRQEQQYASAIEKHKRKAELQDEIKRITETYEDTIPTCSEIRENMTILTEYREKHTQMAKKLEEGPKLSHSLQSFELQLKKQEARLQSCKPVEKCPNDKEEDLRYEIESQEKIKIKLQSIQEELNNNLTEIQTLENKLVSHENKDISALEIELSTSQNELREMVEKLRTTECVIGDIQKYQTYMEEYKKYKEWEGKVEDLTEKESLCKRKYAACTLLKEKILQAENMAITNVINSINAHAAEYLEIFFPEEPLSAQLMAFKQNKKGTSNKPQINLEITYKEMEADIGTLSGGELSRVILAFTLALSEIFNTPLLLLDECTASLDQDTTSIVMNGIRRNFGDKLVIVVAHQVVSGDFDQKIIACT